MHRSGWTPSIVSAIDRTIYLVADDFGPLGRVWRETDLEAADLEAVIRGLLAGEYNDPIRIVACNTVEVWATSRRTSRKSYSGGATSTRSSCLRPCEAFSVDISVVAGS
ncbi:hypothetical protein ACVIGA_001688 [Bradyrhizobium sp. USDA 3240]